MEKASVVTSELFTGQFIFLNALFALVYSNIAFFFVYPLFLESIGESKASIGWIMGALPLSTVVVRPLMPEVLRRLGQRKTMGLGLVVIFAASASYHLISRAGLLLFLVRILHGLGFSAFVAASYTAAAHMVPSRRRAEAFGYIGALILTCVASAPVLGERLIHGFGYPALFHSAAATAFLGMVVLTFIRTWNEPPPEKSLADGLRNLLHNRSLWLVLAATLLFVNTNATLLTFIALYGEEQGISGPIYYAWIALLAVCIRVFGSKLMDRHGKKSFSGAAFLLLGIGMLLMSLGLYSTHLYLISSILYGTGLGYLYPGLNALAVDQAEPEERAIVMSLFTAVVDSGLMLGAVVSGFLADNFGLARMFTIVGSVALLGMVIITRRPVYENPPGH